MTASVTTITTLLMAQAIAPHCANWVSVSMSLVTRAVRTPVLLPT